MIAIYLKISNCPRNDYKYFLKKTCKHLANDVIYSFQIISVLVRHVVCNLTIHWSGVVISYLTAEIQCATRLTLAMPYFYW